MSERPPERRGWPGLLGGCGFCMKPEEVTPLYAVCDLRAAPQLPGGLTPTPRFGAKVSSSKPSTQTPPHLCPLLPLSRCLEPHQISGFASEEKANVPSELRRGHGLGVVSTTPANCC